MRNFTFKGLFLAGLFMVLGCLSIQAADDDGLITKQITIKLEKAGTLPNKIGSTKKFQITNLKIIGEINGTDLCFIREMAGSDREGWRTEGKLATLDLSGAKIVRGGGIYYNSVNCYTSDDVIGNYAFSDCSGLTSLILPSNVTSIGYSAFYGCICLTSLTLPSSVTSIGSSAFEACYGLFSLTLPSSVTEIGESAFRGCCSLASLTLPSSVTSIGKSAFEGCSGLTSIYVSWESPLSIDASTFKDANTGKCILYVPKGTYDDYWLSNWGIFENIVEYDATGIDHITTSGEAKEISRYAADGQRLEVPAKGLNIVKYSDGCVKKVVVQ